MERAAHDLSEPLMFTSSSLGDDLVTRPRRELFDRLVRFSASPRSGQSLFHRHAWRARPEISVRMRRADASTVSRTAVTISARTIVMTYTRLDTALRRRSRELKLSLVAA